MLFYLELVFLPTLPANIILFYPHCLQILFYCDKPVGVAKKAWSYIKKNSLKKGSATDPIPKGPRLTVELTFVVKKLSVELTFDYLFPL